MKATLITMLVLAALVMAAMAQLPIAGWVDGFRVH